MGIQPAILGNRTSVGVLEATASRYKEMQNSLFQGSLEFVSSKCGPSSERQALASDCTSPSEHEKSPIHDRFKGELCFTSF